ncbi:MAG: ATP-binding protein, partial [Bacteroidota bacterium]
WLALTYQAFVFGHTYILTPGTQVETALGIFICVAPLFFRGVQLWSLLVLNAVMFHVSLWHADYDQFFNGLYFFFLVLFGVVWTLVRDNERYEKDLLASKAQVEKNAAQLEQAYAFKTRFFINITHELRTPLTLILSPIRSLLKRNTTPTDDRQLLKVVDKNAEILLSRVNQLLELAKIDRNEIEIKQSQFDVVQLILALKDQFLPLAMTKQINLVAEDFTVEHRMIESDKVKLEMVLSNLLSNALKFTPVGGRVAIEANDKGPNLQIAVRDNGIGIPEKEKEKIFERFYQVRTDDYYEGTGIGLALSQELIHQLGGEIWVEGNPDQGTSFFITLPKNPAPSISRKGIKKSPKTIQPSLSIKPTLLVVEDNQDLSQYLQLLLRQKYQVLLAANGQEAIDILEQLHQQDRKPDLIITDLMMPILNGQELVQQVKKDSRFLAIPIVVMTALSELGLKLDLLRIGIDDYLTKPFFEQELLTMIEKQLPDQKGDQEEATPSILSSDLDWLKQVERLVLKKVDDHDFKLQDLASELFMSQRNLQIKIKQLTGKTPKQYQRAIVLQFARDQIQAGRFSSVSAAASSLGFEDQHYFSTLYKKHFGISPKAELDRLKS